MNKQELIDELTKYVKRYEDEMDEYDQGRLGAYRVALALTRQLDEPKKPVVPKFVANWYEMNNKNLEYRIWKYIKNWDDQRCNDFKNWMGKNSIKSLEILTKMQYGYEVEKEQLYYVRLPFEVWDEDAAEIKTEYFYLHYDITSDETRLFTTKKTMKDFVSKLDEATIKSTDEKYWAFAVPVEEVEG